MGSFLGNKKKRSNLRPPPGYPQRRAPPPQIVEVKRRFSSMKSKALIYSILGAAASAVVGFVLNAALPSFPGLSIGATAAVAVLFAYLAVNQALNAYSYYLFMRLKMELSAPKQAVEAPSAAPQPPQPVQRITVPPVETAPPISRPTVNVEVPPVVQAKPKPAPAAVTQEKPGEALQPQEPVIEIKEAAPTSPPVEVRPPQPPVKQATTSAVQPRFEEPRVSPQPLKPVQPPTTPAAVPSQPASSGKKVCPYCGRELPYGDLHVICPYCGRRLK